MEGMKCKFCGDNIISNSTDATKDVCDKEECQRRKEYFPFLEPYGSVSIRCPYCKKDISMVLHKEVKV